MGYDAKDYRIAVKKGCMPVPAAVQIQPVLLPFASSNANELEEFKWTLSDYIKHGQESALNGQWIKQLENASAKFHISKYQAMMIDG